MMNKILLLALIATPTLWAQSGSEEAIILNQELQFLEETANNVTIISAAEKTPQERARPLETSSLEKKYFESNLEDDVSTKAAGRKRRSY